MYSFKRKKDIEALLEKVAKLPPVMLAFLVGTLEATEVGQLVISKKPNQELYAALKPKHEENVQRLRALLELADENISRCWELSIQLVLPFAKFSDYINWYCRNGQISNVVSADLNKRLWAETWSEVANVLI